MHMPCEVVFYGTLQSFHSTKYYFTSQGLCNGVGLEVWVGGVSGGCGVGGESFMPRRTNPKALPSYFIHRIPCAGSPNHIEK